MRTDTARTLAQLTTDFYAQVSASFSATRADPWEGWGRVLREAEPTLAGDRAAVLDLACGNLRFERFLDSWAARRAVEMREAPRGEGKQGSVGPAPIEAYAFDSCDDLARLPELGRVTVRYGHLDVAEALLAGEDLATRMTAPPCDLAVCFGFMHHLAQGEHREQVLRALVSSVRPGGVVAVSFWQLSKSDRLLRKAEVTTALARERLALDDLGPRDYLLGWQGRDDVLRYCHDFSEDEVDGLARAVSPAACEVARYSADGATGDLNRYLVLRRRA